jgi:antibiotic biosynthesis monooxygenase (ABM) superfamily enzyme
MFAVIYRFKLKPHQEADYQKYWRDIATYFREYSGALGSCLHKGENGLWVAYSRWPDKATRDAAWPGSNQPNIALPVHIRETIQKVQAILLENNDLGTFEEMCLDVLEDLLA